MRLTNRLLALLLGLALGGAGGLAVAELVAGLTGRAPLLVPRGTWHQRLSALEWSDPALTGAAAGLVVLGLVLLLAQVVPRRPLELPLQPAEDQEASIDRRGLQEVLRRVAIADPDVIGATVRVRRRAKVRVQLPPKGERRAARDRLQQSLAAAVGELGLSKRLAVKVDARQGRERVR